MEDDMATEERISMEEREKMIAEGAYYLAQQRGFERGDPIGDWLEAEKQIDATFDLQPHDTKLAQLYEQLAAANEKLIDLTGKIKEEAREEWEEEVDRIHDLRDEFSDKLEEIREAAGEAKEKAKLQADELWENLVKGLKRFSAPRQKAE